MSIARRCPECELLHPLAEFAPRDSSVYDRPVIPCFDEIERQSRCADCNRVYHRRRSFVRGTLASRAGELGVEVAPISGTVYRRVTLKTRKRSAPAAVIVLLELVKAFNVSLPDARCEVPRHGVTAEWAERRPRDAPRQRELFARTSRTCAAPGRPTAKAPRPEQPRRAKAP